jgi:hypothetical protein
VSGAQPSSSSAELAASAVRAAVVAVGTVLFLDSQRKEACSRKAYNRELNDLVLTAERQFLWDALRRLQDHEHDGRPVLLSERGAKHLERLDSLRGSLGAGDAASAQLVLDLQRELRLRTRAFSPAASAAPGCTSVQKAGG